LGLGRAGKVEGGLPPDITMISGPLCQVVSKLTIPLRGDGIVMAL
jgi:hypothetical protein